MIRTIAVALLLVPLPILAAKDAPDAQTTADAVRAEVLRGNDDPAGRPLPVSAHWNSGHDWHRRGMNPAFQVTLVEKGHHHLVNVHLPAPGHTFHDGDTYFEAPVKRLAELRLPFAMESTQWERLLTAEKRWFDLPAGENPNVVTAGGKVLKKVSPFGPVEHWQNCGRAWSDREHLRKLAEWYPAPPRVIFLSNNEHAKLSWHEAESSKRYLAEYGKGKDANLKRKAFADGWIERYRALQAGMRDGLPSDAWKKAARFVGYEAFGPAHLGRWGGWMEYSLYTPGRIDPWPLAWDGGSPSYYVHNWNPSTDHTVWGPQVESQNWVPMLDEALRLNPDFWWEISVWDGHEPKRDDDMRKVYARKGQDYGPARYRGFVQYGMWLLRPRAVREFRGWTDTREDMMPYFGQVLAAVDRLYRDPTLQRFWRKGRLVPNRDVKHPYQANVPEDVAKLDRWFLLDTSATPERPWKLDTVIPVFASALELGEGPFEGSKNRPPSTREWLIYAHAPLGERKDVTIALPGFGPVTADVAVGGTFIHVTEEARQVKALVE